MLLLRPIDAWVYCLLFWSPFEDVWLNHVAVCANTIDERESSMVQMQGEKAHVTYLNCTNYGKISGFTYEFRRFETCRFASSRVKEKNRKMKWSKNFQLSIVLLHQWEIRLHVNRIWICRWNFDTNVRAHTHTHRHTRGDRVMSLPCFRCYERALRSSHTDYLLLYRSLIHPFSQSLNSSAEPFLAHHSGGCVPFNSTTNPFKNLFI